MNTDNAYQRGEPHPEWLAALAEIVALGDPELSTMTPPEARAARAARFAGVRPTPVAAVDEVAIAGVPCRTYRPTSALGPGLIWLHGGGWVLGGWDTHDEIFRLLATRTGHHVVAPEYRLAPEHPFPAGLQDSLDVVAAVDADPERYGIADTPALGGDSAGGNLAAVAALTMGGRRPAQLALAYPVTDCRFGWPSFREDATTSYLTPATMEWFRDHYLTDAAQVDDWRVSPLLAANEQLATLGETFVLVASHDPLRDEGIAFAERIVDAGGRVQLTLAEGFAHGLLSLAARSPAASHHFDELVAFLRAGVQAS
jgi:acetyl esterase